MDKFKCLGSVEKSFFDTNQCDEGEQNRSKQITKSFFASPYIFEILKYQRFMP